MPLSAELRLLKDFLERLEAWDNIAVFARRYLPHYLTAEPAPFHLELYREMEAISRSHAERGNEFGRFVCAAPRGHGKSVLVSLIYPLWCICPNRKKFIVLISSSSNIAEGLLASIIAELENNELIRKDFGEMVGTEKWTSREILTKNKVRVVAKGSNSTLRGLRNFETRPDLIICDDLEDEEIVNTQEQREKLEAWFNKTVMNLQGVAGDVFVIGTVLHYDSLLSKLLKRWNGKRYQAISSDGAILWASYYTKERLDKIKYGDGKKEGIGSLAFESEYQNNPIDSETQIIKGEWIRYYKMEELGVESSELRVNGLDSQHSTHNSQPSTLLIYSGLDPSVGGKDTSDYSAIVTVGECKGKIYVLDCDMQRRSPQATVEAALRCYKKWSNFKFQIPNHKSQTNSKSQIQNSNSSLGFGNCNLGFISQYVCMAIESNAFQVVLKQMIDDMSKKLGVFIPTMEIRNVSDKVARLCSISPLIENGIISFLPEQYQLIEQLVQFPKASHDDGPDALEMAIRVLRKQKLPRVRTL